jgi:hypothetical protein
MISAGMPRGLVEAIRHHPDAGPGQIVIYRWEKLVSEPLITFRAVVSVEDGGAGPALRTGTTEENQAYGRTPNLAPQSW